MRDMWAVTPGMLAWALITGVAMVKGGLSVPLALAMALTVFSAGAQLAAVPLMMTGTPLWVIWLTALCVNLRFVIFSVQMRRHLMTLPWRQRLLAGYLCADLCYVLTQQRHGSSPPADAQNPEALAYFMGLFAVNWSTWVLTCCAGVWFADQIPMHWGMGFAGTLALLGLLVTLVKDRLTGLSAALAGTAAVAAYGMPFKLHIVVAVAAAVAAGLLAERVAAPGKGPGAPAGADQGAP